MRELEPIWPEAPRYGPDLPFPPYRFVSGESGMPLIHTAAGDRSPVQVSADILSALKQRAEDTREAILTAGVELFSSQGFDGTSIRAIEAAPAASHVLEAAASFYHQTLQLARVVCQRQCQHGFGRIRFERRFSGTGEQIVADNAVQTCASRQIDGRDIQDFLPRAGQSFSFGGSVASGWPTSSHSFSSFMSPTMPASCLPVLVSLVDPGLRT